MNRNISEQELAICRMFGNNPDEYSKTREQDNVTAMNRDGLIRQGVMTEHELAICRQMGVSPADYFLAKVKDIFTALNREGFDPAALSAAKKNIMKLFNIAEHQAARIIADNKMKAEARATLTIEELEACRLLGVQPLEYQGAKMEAAGL